MALLLPHWTSSLHSLHQLASLRHRVSLRSRRSVRANDGATSTRTQVSTNDQIKISSSEPCCKIKSIVMAPMKPARRSTRLRAKKSREGAKTQRVEEMEAAEWASINLTNNGVVEVDPVTMAELNGGKTDVNTHNRIASLTTSSEVSDYFPPRGSGFPRFPGVPFEVLVAAGSAVALATVAAVLNTLSKQRAGAKPSESDYSEGNYLGSDFAGEPVKSANAPQLTRDKKLPAEVLASTAGLSAGAAILTAFDLQPGSVRTGLDKSSMPLPPSLSKTGPPREQRRKWASVTSFFTPQRSSESSPKPAPSDSKWSEEKLKSVAPFFSSDRNGASSERVTPSFANEQQGTSVESVTPFFADDRGKNGPFLEGVTPSFGDEQQGSESSSGTSLENVAPFFADEVRGREVKNGPSLEGVTPFFADEVRGRDMKNGPSSEDVTPFFADEVRGREMKNGPSLEGVAPFFADEVRGREMKTGPSLEGFRSFFADEQQGSESINWASVESVTPFFADEVRGRELKNGPSLEGVTPFFVDERGRGVSLENGTPFFPDEQGRSSPQTLKYQNVTPFFPDDRMGSSNEATRDSGGITPGYSTQFTDPRSVGNERVLAAVSEDLRTGPMRSEGKQLLAEMANRSQDQHREFMGLSTADRFGSSYGGAEAPSVARDLTPEELAILEEIKEEEARQEAKFRALQAAFPALAIGAGAVGALVGVDGAFEMVGVTATASFISYELLWANKRRELLDEVSRITDHHKLFSFLRRRKILKDDC